MKPEQLGELKWEAEEEEENGSGKVRIPEPGTVYLRLPKNYFEPRMLITVLRKIFEE